MRILLSIIITAIVVTVIFLWLLTFKPTWVAMVQFDADGFPRIKKEGDKFTIGNSSYTYTGGVWTLDIPDVKRQSANCVTFGKPPYEQTFCGGIEQRLYDGNGNAISLNTNVKGQVAFATNPTISRCASACLIYHSTLSNGVKAYTCNAACIGEGSF